MMGDLHYVNSKSMTPFPPRIHVLLAIDAPVGLIIRRGPSKQVATMLWDRQRDRFELGQWFKGRIYERRSDLSPDGKYLIYFAMNGQWQSESKGSWTAISQAPYLKAIAFLPKGDGWHGGGLWTGKATYWLNDGYGHTIGHDTSIVRRDKDYTPTADYGGECLSVYYHRLLRDGWRLVDRIEVAKWNHEDIFEKTLEKGWILRKIAHAGVNTPEGKGCYWDEHALVNAKTGAIVSYPDWEWADRDGKRLVWAAAGKLYAGRIESLGLTQIRELFDFNGMQFERKAAPY
jgi:hypothetical protein